MVVSLSRTVLNRWEAKPFPPTREASRQVGLDLARFTEGIQEDSKNLTQWLSFALPDAFQPFDFRKLLEPLYSAAETFKTLPDRTRVCVLKAALRGWFVVPDLPARHSRSL